jgi:leucyl aminopeptidase
VDFSVVSGPLSEIEADLVVLFIGEDGAAASELGDKDAQLGELVAAARNSEGFKGGAFQYEWIFPAPGKAKRVLLVGTGKQDALDLRRLRQMFAASVRQGRSKGAKSICLVLPTVAGVERERAAQAATDAATTALFEPDLYKAKREESTVERLLIWQPGEPADLQSALARGEAVGTAVNFGRWLAEEPANIMTPPRAADEAQKMARENGIECEILDEDALRAAGMNSLVSVSDGSQWPPRVVVLRLKTGGDSPTIGLVGKGVTFDTGGISIKPAQDMHYMKYDMCGAAAVISAVLGLAKLGAKVNVIAVAGFVENMPGGKATKPGDVVRAANGKTIEIINTDAEGRLVLADALDLARKRGAEKLVDVATLTGAIVIALGAGAAGVMGTPQDWVETVTAAATQAGERAWQMPLYPEYKDQLKSNIADMMNVGGRPAGALTAGTFLREFVDDTPWAHLDIAGTAWAEKDTAWQTRGATGVMIRTLIELAETAGSPV